MMKEWQIRTLIVMGFGITICFASEIEKPKEKQGVCGHHPFLKNYCYYKLADEKWLICSERYGGCPIRLKALDKSLFKIDDLGQGND